ncbi:MAG: dienelactone hydrolase family protein [Chloroflexota bacterium]|nr:dienelactone hydrolase family protein [Chloroflexota bacterium]MDQ5867357.1 dienelactone hydrolase family protein [Chloroflexota bacterium]
MCYDDKARPPMPPTTGGQVRTEDLVLTAADGNSFAAFLAEPSNPSGAQIVIYPDVRGLHGFYKDLALRFAETGVRALAIDYFGRTAGLTARDDSFEFMPHVQQLTVPTFFQDVRAALDYLGQGHAAGRATFVVGFCMGGSLVLLSATQDFNLAGGIAFYAGMTRDFGGYGTALQHADQVKYPVLGLFGGADAGIPVAQVEELDARLDQSRAPHEIVIYPDAPHSFFDRKATDYAEASADAWRRMLLFIETFGQPRG